MVRKVCEALVKSTTAISFLITSIGFGIFTTDVQIDHALYALLEAYSLNAGKQKLLQLSYGKESLIIARDLKKIS